MSDAPVTHPAQPAQAADRQSLDSIQALRGIASLLVVLYHLAGTEEKYGHARDLLIHPFRFFGAEGVDLFFVISGFIILWTNDGSFGQPHKIPKYMARRITRIFPLYWLFFALAYAMGRLGFSHALDAASAPSNLVAIFFLLPIEATHIVPVSWTLTFELFFYCVFAAMLWLKRDRFPAVLLAWFGLVVLANVVPWAPPSTTVTARVAYVALGFRTIQFMFGCAVALFLKRRSLPHPLLWLAAGVALFGASGLRVAQIERRTPLDDLWQPELVVLFGVAAALIVAGAVAYERNAKGKGKIPRALVTLGDASYSLYLSHLFVFAILRRFIEPLNGPGFVPHVLWLMTLGAAALVGGFVSYRFVERPILRRLSAATNRRFPT